jgi:hypothetical protein
MRGPILYGGPPPPYNNTPQLESVTTPSAPRITSSDVATGPLFEDNLPHAGPTFALAISHCPWRPERAAVMAENRPLLVRTGIPYREITDRMPNWQWSRLMWGWGAVQPVTHTVYLQDDIRVHPAFWWVVAAMVRAVPNRVISLISNHPLARRAFEAGHHWLKCGETLGTGYVVPTVLMPVFLDHRDRLPQAFLESTPEDFVFTRWLCLTGRRAWHPIPAIIQTIEGIETTNPAISYPFRKSSVPWDLLEIPRELASPEYWTPGSEPPDYGPTVANDSRLPAGPFTNAEIMGTRP